MMQTQRREEGSALVLGLIAAFLLLIVSFEVAHTSRIESFITYNIDTPAFVGSHHDIVAALIFCQPTGVDYSFINGKKVVDQGRLTTIDLEKLIATCNQLAQSYVQAS